jgi:hypothetical protein
MVFVTSHMPSRLIEAGLDTGLDTFFIVKTMVFETSHMPSRLIEAGLDEGSDSFSLQKQC